MMAMAMFKEQSQIGNQAAVGGRPSSVVFSERIKSNENRRS